MLTKLLPARTLRAGACVLALLLAPALTRAQSKPAAVDKAALAARLAHGAPATTPLGVPTALEKYIAHDDGAFTWELAASTKIDRPVPGTWHALRMTSQLWRTKDEVNIPEWTHWVCIWIPQQIASDKAILFIGGGRRKADVPTSPPRELQMLAPAGAIAITIDNVPNQPTRLGSDPADRSEDGLVARTWINAMDTGDPTWIARFPMVKAAVKAMDATEQFFAKHPQTAHMFQGKPLDASFRPASYLVAGGSKRGWTTWLTAAVDKRVGALVPLVIDVLDIPAQMRHHHAAYGFWAPALSDYVETGLTDRFALSADSQAEPALAAVLAHDDPIHWLSRVGAKPKLLINASGDEFFLPDSSRFYEDRLPQPWRIRYQPNSGHSLKDTTAVADLIAFYRAWAGAKELPQLSWSTTSDSGSGDLLVSVTSSVTPERARLWSVTTPAARDFRLSETAKSWTSSDLTAAPGEGTRFQLKLQAPASGFRAAFVELTYPAEPGSPPLTFTTRVFVLPDTLLHAKK